MFNKKEKDMNEEKNKVWLVIEKNVYGETNPTQTFSVIKFHKTIEENYQ